MTLDVNMRLNSLLAEIAASGKSYSAMAKGVAESLSEAREPIQLPQSVIELMGTTSVPDITPYDQADLLAIMDAMAKTLLYARRAPDTTEASDGELASLLSEYRSMFSLMTNAQLTSLYTRDAFDSVSPIRGYAMAVILSDIAADRRLPVPQVWQSVIDNYIKPGE